MGKKKKKTFIKVNTYRLPEIDMDKLKADIKPSGIRIGSCPIEDVNFTVFDDQFYRNGFFDKKTPLVELVIIRGLPGSGKSTLAKKAFPDHLHYEPDHLFSDTNGRYLFDAQLFDKAKDFVLSMTDYALSRGESVVVSDVFPKIEELKPYVDLANYHDVSIRVIYTNADYGNVHRVPKYVLDDMLNVFEANEVHAYERVGIKAESVSSDVYYLVGQ